LIFLDPSCESGAAVINRSDSVTVSIDKARLKRRAEFLAARNGERFVGRGFVIQSRQRSSGEIPREQPRFGFTASRKTGNAVVRNRLRRRLREVVRLCKSAHLQPERDYVLIARRAALYVKFASLMAELEKALRQTSRDRRGRYGSGGDGKSDAANRRA
jgi:ribonuclease P protein component